MKSVSNSWLFCPQPKPQARLRLFCFPYAGGGASLYRTWVNYLPSDVELCAIQLPGRETRFKDKLFTRLSPLVAELTEAIRPYLDRPFAFFGHSLGACISYELTRQLRRLQAPVPKHLFISGCGAPPLPLRQVIHHLPRDEFISEISRLQGTPEAVLKNAELMELMAPVLRADFTIRETYQYKPEPPLNCPLSAFGGRRDPLVYQEDLIPWQEMTTGAFTLRMFDGNHFFLHSAQAAVLEALTGDLAALLSALDNP